MGGLAAAAILARAGLAVTVVDKAPHVGGKLRVDQVAGRQIDAGPTVLTMRWALERVFREAGAELSDEVALEPLETLARHFFEDGSQLDLFTDQLRSERAVAAFAGQAEAEAFRKFSAYAARIYQLVEGPFLTDSRPTFGSMLARAGKLGPSAMLAIDGHRTMQSALTDFFRDPRLLALFARYATYVGSSPLTAPATLNVIAHVESLGVSSVQGGMTALPNALARVAARHGVEFRLGTEVSQILVEKGRAAGVRLSNGEVLSAPWVVFNGDVSALTGGLLGANVKRAAPETKRRSLSAVTMSVVGRVHGAHLTRHNVFFSQDTRREFLELDSGRIPVEPTIYVCAQDRGDRGAEQDGPERLFFIVNAPAGSHELATDREKAAWAKHLLDRLDRRFGAHISPEGWTVTTPRDFAQRYPGTEGAIYGPQAVGMASTFARASERANLPGLYLAGGSAHPGAGVPMAAQSGLLSARAVLSDLASTAPLRMTGTLGGTWMR